jgi:hypothetical protein
LLVVLGSFDTVFGQVTTWTVGVRSHSTRTRCGAVHVAKVLFDERAHESHQRRLRKRFRGFPSPRILSSLLSRLIAKLRQRHDPSLRSKGAQSVAGTLLEVPVAQRRAEVQDMGSPSIQRRRHPACVTPLVPDPAEPTASTSCAPPVRLHQAFLAAQWWRIWMQSAHQLGSKPPTWTPPRSLTHWADVTFEDWDAATNFYIQGVASTEPTTASAAATEQESPHLRTSKRDAEIHVEPDLFEFEP